MSSIFPRICVCVLAFALSIVSLAAQTTSSPELEALLLDYKSRVAQQVEAPYAKAVGELSQSYIKALDRAQQETAMRGKLDEAAAFKAEKEAVVAGPAQGLPALQPGLRELPPMRRKYVDAEEVLRAGMQRKLEPMQRELVRQIEVLALRLARAGRTDAALEARLMAKSYSENTGLFGAAWEDHTRKVTPKADDVPIILKKGATVSTEASFKPPVEIEVVAKIEGLDLRLGYAADQVIFNWETRPTELRIDGGPANKSYTPKQGEIPKGKFVTIRWFVSKDRQTISVDGAQRFEHQGDYADINRQISIHAFGSEAAVQSIKVRKPLMP